MPEQPLIKECPHDCQHNPDCKKCLGHGFCGNCIYSENNHHCLNYINHHPRAFNSEEFLRAIKLIKTSEI